MIRISILFFALLFSCSALFSQELTGNVRSWAMDSFIGFDPVGDASGSTGDIASVFAKTENGKFILLITSIHGIINPARIIS